MESFLSLAGSAALKAAILLALGGIATALLRSAAASTRHLVWTVSVASALILPFAGLVLDVAGGPRIPVSMWRPTVTITADIEPPGSASPAIDAVAPELSSEAALVPGVLEAQSERAAEALGSPVTAEFDLPSVVGMAAQSAAGGSMSGSWKSIVVLAWLAGAIAALLPLIVAVLRVRFVTRNATPLETSRWHRIMNATPAMRHMANRTRILESDTASMPMTWGIIRPTLLLPADSGMWSDDQCRNILLHELAHVERRDCLTQLVAQITCAVYWFNPLSWLAAQRMRVERELACDDVVLTAGSKASDYAANLLEVARSLHSPAFTSQTAIAMARPSQLSGRLLAVLDSRRDRRRVSPRLVAGAAMSAIVAVVVLASLTPRSADAAMASDRMPGVTVTTGDADRSMTSAGEARAFPLPAAIVRAAQIPVTDLAAAITPFSSDKAASVLGPLSAKAEALRIPALGALPASAQAVCWAGSAKNSKNTSVSISSNDEDGSKATIRATFKQNDCTLELRAQGKFTLRADLSDVESISSGGWLRVEEDDGRNTRRVEIRPSGGSLDHIYTVNGRRAEFDAGARAWLAETLLAVERRTAFAAKTRVPQLYSRGGTRGVLDEIAQMGGDYAKSRYYGELLDMNISLDNNALNDVVRRASDDLSGSDYYTSEVLGKLARHGAANESTWRVFAEAAGRMESDYYKSELLKKVLEKGQLSSATVGVLLRSASGIKSDHYLSELLKAVANRYALNDDTRQFYVQALQNIESDYYRSELLKSMKGGGRWDSRTKAFVLAAVGDIKSDYYRSESLIALVREDKVEDWPAFFKATSSIDSDHYKRATTSAVLDRDPLTRPMIVGVLSVAQQISSDYEASELLSTVARRYRMDDELRATYEKALERISSSYYRDSARSALMRSAAR
jgi:beta-lactamase regulating signal transducer with metallopeptidase domain